MQSSVNPSAGHLNQRLSEARGGSTAAQGEILELCRRYLLLVANRELEDRLRAKGGASDLVQETLLEAHRDFAKFEGTTRAEVLAWLRRILLNNLSNFRRRYAQAENRCVAREVSLDGTGPFAQLKHTLARDTTSPESRAAALEASAALDRGLELLADDYREVILLRHAQGLSFGEIGQLMDRTDEAARKLYVRAIERLRQELKRFRDSSA
jgi:RNA polymerase sigma-70 factor (ECF subfamily)